MTEFAKSVENRHNPRSAENMDMIAAELLAPPRNPLEEEERVELFRFEDELLNGVYQSPAGGLELALLPEGTDILEINEKYGYADNRHELSLDFFVTDEGREALQTASIALETDATTSDVAHILRKHAFDIGGDTLKKWAKASEEFVAQKIVDAITADQNMPDPERIVVYSDLSKILQRADGFFSFRRFLNRIIPQEETQNSGDNLSLARGAVISMYKKRIGAEIATLYPELLHIWGQAEEMTPELRGVIHNAMQQINPPLSRMGPRFVEKQRPIVIMLDHLRNGSSEAPDGRTRTAVSQAVEDLFDQEAATAESLEKITPEFTPDEIKKLDSVKFDAEHMQAFCKDILSQMGKLSSEPEDSYYSGRTHHAADGLWQVVVMRDKATSAMGAEEPEGILEIPEKFNRGLTKATAPVGVIPGAAHEITHIFQHDNARNAPGTLALARNMRGKRSVVMAEAGAKLTESILQRRLFGRALPDSPHYARAIQAIEGGAGEVEAIKTFYESYRQQNPDASSSSAASTAVSRVKRLIRRRGGFDSQALDYAETAIIANAAHKLPQEVQNVLFSQAAFDPSDYATLHRFGILPQAVEPFPIEQYLGIVVPKLRDMLASMDANE